jgi:ADP-heptose:LPS heptosyltransferase
MSIGFAQPGMETMVTHAVAPPASDMHEIDMRLSLLDVLDGDALHRGVSIAPPDAEAIGAEVRDYNLGDPSLILNIGARLKTKQLTATQYAKLATACSELGRKVVLTYGPSERAVAEEVANASSATLAPPTHLMELAFLMQRAQCVVTCDTGPMHLSVALGTPTCGLFVDTGPQRFGYNEAPNLAIDLREKTMEAAVDELRVWLRQQRKD